MRYSESLGEVGARGHSRGFERAAVENREKARRSGRKGLRREEARICKVAFVFYRAQQPGVETRKTAGSIGPGVLDGCHWQLGRGWQAGKGMKARGCWGVGRR